MVAGGTGGHLIPAIAFGQWLSSHHVSWSLATGSRPLERQICEAHGVHAHYLPIVGSPLGGGLKKAPGRTLDLVRTYRAAKKLIREEASTACLLFGGYLSLPVFWAARQAGIRTMTHEQNVLAGRGNRMLARLGCPVASGWSECRGISRFQYTGIPVRAMSLTDRAEAQRLLLKKPLEKGKKLAVVVGGSLGSRGIGEDLERLSNMVESKAWFFLFVGAASGSVSFDNALTVEPQWNMTLAYSAADLVISRAGGATLAEIEALRLRALVVPWEGSAGGHQLANAQLFNKETGTPYWTGDEGLSDAFSRAAGRELRWPEGRSGGSEALWDALQSVNAEGR